MIRRFSLLLLYTLFLPAILSCGSSVDELVDTIEDPDRQPIDKSRTGVNNFFVDREFGNISEQYRDIRTNLGVRYVRVLVAWTNGVQPSPAAEPNFGFFDEILDSIPADTDVLVTVVHTPDWMTNSANWIGGNPRATWVEKWLKPVVSRYAGRGGISGWEIWNEPDLTVVPSDSALELETPANYAELLALGAQAVRSLDPGKLVIGAATSSINQNFPSALDYNKELRSLGAVDQVDVWNVHYYGKQFNRVVQNDGVADFLNGLGKVIWITESGEQGPNNQLDYVERTWPFLKEKIPGIDRFYYYQYGSTAPLDTNFGLRTTDPSFPVSDLYIHLRDG